MPFLKIGNMGKGALRVETTEFRFICGEEIESGSRERAGKLWESYIGRNPELQGGGCGGGGGVV